MKYQRYSNLAFAGLVCFALHGNEKYIAKVYDYKPAPGQFINILPEYEEGDTRERMNAKCLEYIGGVANGSPVSLGGWGGYIVFGFDHTVINSGGEYDFNIYGNTFANASTTGVGSSEPGIVMVSLDTNGNGLPDDEWYELKGSEHTSGTIWRNMNIKYFAPQPNRPLAADPDPDDSGVCDRSYIRWESNHSDKKTGYIQRVTFHTQSYWPSWINDGTLEFTGTLLPENFTLGDGGQYTFRWFEWGYADNLPNTANPGFRISDAINAEGDLVNLPGADFIKVYTGINQTCGSLGEGSTEICGAEDLHPDMSDGVAEIQSGDLKIVNDGNGHITVINESGETKHLIISNLQGNIYLKEQIPQGTNQISTDNFTDGIYIVNLGGNCKKLPIFNR